MKIKQDHTHFRHNHNKIIPHAQRYLFGTMDFSMKSRAAVNHTNPTDGKLLGKANS